MKELSKELSKLLYTSKFWDSYYEFAEKENTLLADKHASTKKEIFILSNFLGVLGYLDDPFSHITEIQEQWELCDDTLKETLLTGWNTLEDAVAEDYDYNIEHDASGNKINNEENINLS